MTDSSKKLTKQLAREVYKELTSKEFCVCNRCQETNTKRKAIYYAPAIGWVSKDCAKYWKFAVADAQNSIGPFIKL